MRYMLMHRLDQTNAAAWQPDPEFMAKMGAFMEEVGKAGVLLAAEGLTHPSAGAQTITVKSGQTTVVDGPFAEAKEVIGGFGILQVRDEAEAVEWGRRFAALFDEVTVEVRRVSEFE
ncbi:YciI family protein [Dactylosporangium sp. AC04546]|uniref:YciI family protein n=1 Tax=Dactylosporangium sp. AC04546 TaxID=2862460 RepID=UPI001EDE0BE7|nr:YciI family protein [Dactylosporangium sp. AC04546]WVK85008.1 YciI family protein [Dactylosporangium sp. AC04546]